MASDESVAIHIATYIPADNGYGLQIPDAILVRPITVFALEYFLTGYGVMGDFGVM